MYLISHAYLHEIGIKVIIIRKHQHYWYLLFFQSLPISKLHPSQTSNLSYCGLFTAAYGPHQWYASCSQQHQHWSCISVVKTALNSFSPCVGLFIGTSMTRLWEEIKLEQVRCKYQQQKPSQFFLAASIFCDKFYDVIAFSLIHFTSYNTNY